MKPENRRLYAPNTYQHTERLENLLADTESVTQRDVRELFSEFSEGSLAYSSHVSLTEFAAWILGTMSSDIEPCEIFW